MNIVLITGISGSGKSVALHALEDAGCYCVDNLPPELLLPLVTLELSHYAGRCVAIAVDVRSASSLPQLPHQLESLRQAGHQVRIVFLDATTETLVRRYSETRRRHPLSQGSGLDAERILIHAIEAERELLADLRNQAHVIDTSLIRAAQLQQQVKEFLGTASHQLTLVFQSFAFKRGVPLDADFVFDVRMLPNPHYEAPLRALTGCDQPVADFLREQPGVGRMQQQITDFLREWLPELVSNHRSYVTVAIGCTGGQHRSVYLVEALTLAFASEWITLKRHRELTARTSENPAKPSIL